MRINLSGDIIKPNCITVWRMEAISLLGCFFLPPAPAICKLIFCSDRRMTFLWRAEPATFSFSEVSLNLMQISENRECDNARLRFSICMLKNVPSSASWATSLHSSKSGIHRRVVFLKNKPHKECGLAPACFGKTSPACFDRQAAECGADNFRFYLGLPRTFCQPGNREISFLT